MAARRRRVLGNDPFKRGSAERTPLADAPLPERRTLPPTPELQTARKKKKTYGNEPVPHSHAPDAVMLDGPMAHGSSPAVHMKTHGSEPVAHTHAPDAIALDGPMAHGSSPALRFDPVAHDLTPDGIELEVGTPQAHSHSPAANADPVPHSETPELIERLQPSRGDSSELPAPTEPLALGGTLRGLVRAVRTAVGLASRSTQVDPWGKDTSLAASLRPLANLLYDSYWRVSVDGAEHMPRGPCIVVANHAGALPLDGPMLHLVLRRERPELLESRWLLEDQIFHAPFIGVLANRLGAVRASPENALRLLDEGRPVLVFPEGFQALSKPMRERYQLRKFGRGGYVKIAARARVPIVPVAIVGGEEAMPLLAKLPAGALGLPYLPLTLPPLPVQWKIRFAPAIHLDDAPADVESDPAWVEQTNLRVRDTIDSMLVDLLRDAGKPRVG